ncbi:MAG: helix-turn-helix domain-containing protein [Planctomycetes bacterium]|nr:helix-turn-helix domain-containing protein [Planctomycetota bacterium]
MQLPAIKEVADLLAVSPRHVFALERAGKLPPPVRLGRSKRWSAETIQRWIEAGCPSRDEWSQTKTTRGAA